VTVGGPQWIDKGENWSLSGCPRQIRRSTPDCENQDAARPFDARGFAQT